MTEDPEPHRPERSRERALLLLALLIALLLRLGTAPDVFVGDRGGRVLLDGTDGYYHLRRAALIEAHWPQVPQRDSFLGPPDGGLIQWPPLFDLLLATAARVVPGPPDAALEGVGARLPVLFGLLQVLLVAAVARRLAGPRAGAVAALLAAILPAAVRYTLLGDLDHDPAIESLSLLALLPLAGALRERQEGSQLRLPLGSIALLALALAALPLTWAGSVVYIGLLVALLLVVRLGAGAEPAARLGTLTTPAALLAALVVAPFAAHSPWNGMASGAFAGLSWLHVAALAGLSAASSLLVLGPGAAGLGKGRRWILGSGGAGALLLLALAPRVLPALLAGVRFLGRGEPFLTEVAEARPLLTLFGRFDPRPFLARLSALPLVLPFLAARRFRRSEAGLLFALTFSLYTLALALMQSRYSHAAALALAILGGVVWERTSAGSSRMRLGLFTLALVPCLAAYVSLPGFEGQRFYGRTNDLLTTGMLEVSDYLRSAAPPDPAEGDPAAPVRDAVLAPWDYGHWIHWIGRRATVANPFGPQGQTGFEDGARFWLLEDPAEAETLLRAHRVRWVVVSTDGYPLVDTARLAKVDEHRWLSAGGTVDPQRYVATLGARLAWAGTGPLPVGDRVLPPLPFLHEAFRTRALRPLPDGSLGPLLRVYEVAPQ